ncbi:MAG: TonB-dependent receptor [Rhodoferax sp.]|nr:TonB-dependent receptor [Rhodoferax sp.]
MKISHLITKRTLALGALAGLSVVALTTESLAADALDLGLDELMNIDVTTASRKTQRLHEVAGAIFVITREDIERSGVTSIPEALRMVPGAQVAQLTNNRWAVSVRGFNGRFANKLQVLMDGRSLYSPLFAGVVWEAEDTLLEDVDRIEVIRGPGAAMWGANAVNGVVNIITRKAQDTTGNLLIAGGGSKANAFTAFRHGGQSASGGYYRVWGKAATHNESTTILGGRGNDDSNTRRIGVRGDWSTGAGGRLMATAGAYTTTTGDRWTEPNVASPSGFNVMNKQQVNDGAHALARYETAFIAGSEASLQVYLDHSRVDVSNAIAEMRDTFDLDFQHRLPLGKRHDLIWGLEYRYSHDNIDSTGIVSISPERRDYTLFSPFIHDEISLTPALRFSLGARLEHNSVTGFEPQPNMRMMWTPSPDTAWWGAVSRAVRVPSRLERDIQIDLTVTQVPAPIPPRFSMPMLLRNLPNTGGELDSEKLNAYEFGFRQRWTSRLSSDVTIFHNEYEQLRSHQLSTRELVPFPQPYLIQNVIANNAMTAKDHGLEMMLDFHATPWWRLQASYTYLKLLAHSELTDTFNQQIGTALEGSAPKHQWTLRSSMSLPQRQQLDIWLRYTDSLAQRIDAYTTLDLRYAWRPVPEFELSLVGQNLLGGHHAEFVADYLPSEAVVVERNVYLKAKWQF